MKAIIVDEPFQIRVAQVPKPEIQNTDDVLIRVIAGGICGSDIGIYNGTNSLATYPRLIGHEFGGEVLEVGSGVTKVKPGDYVAVDPVRSCGRCYACAHGRHNVCTTLEVTGVHRDGGFSEFTCAPEHAVHLVDTDKIARDLICLVEPYSIGVQVNHRGGVEKGDQVLIMGSGPIGICIMQVAKSRGAQVMMTDLVDSRLERAREMGADLTVNASRQDVKEEVWKWSNGEGASVVVDSICTKDSFPQSLDLTCAAGRVVMLGLKDVPSAIPQVAVTKKELTVVGSRLSNHRFPEVIEGMEKGWLTPEKLRTHSFSCNDVAEAFSLIQEHPEQVCKVTLHF